MKAYSLPAVELCKINAMSVEELKAGIAAIDPAEWEKLYTMRSLLADRLTVTEAVEMGTWETISVDPETLKEGDHLMSHGFVGKIDQIRVVKRANELHCYCIYLTYVEGDLNMFKYFIESINNGCDKGYRAYAQGNKLAEWHKATRI